MTTYSALDVTGSFAHPLVGSFIIAGGNIGRGRITVRMTNEHTSVQRSADGAIMMSYIAGDDGELEIEVQQTSALHQFLIGWFNAANTAAKLGDSSAWAAGGMVLRNSSTGTGHVLTGIAPSKVTDTPYAEQGSNVTWRLIAANVIYQ